MSQEDIDRAVKDAERFADEDKKVKEAVDTARAEAEADKLREAIKSNDTETIKAATEAFKKVFYEIAEKLYKANAPQGDMGAQGGAGFQNDDGSFNADFTEKK